MSGSKTAEQFELGTLYRHHHGWLLGVLQRRLGCFATAEDLTHDVFTRLLGKSSLPALQEPRAYLAKVAHGLVIDRHRRLRIEQAWREVMQSQPEQEVPSPENQIALLDALSRIDALLDTLPTRTQNIFLMSRLEGMAYSDIAKELNVSLSTVQKDMSRALRHCYQILMG